MRLTLRTLLAWLDDTLPPAEVREIGTQVAESAFAKELVDKIHRVNRQRRLTVPGTSGPDASDPNLVASYLDNELPPEQVADYEKLCLTSDVNLAEVASAHQILSLIGQKAKVPAEAKRRMYLLVQGREAVVSRTPPGPPEHTPVSEPLQPWLTPELPRRPWLERFGPAIGVLAMIAVLCWSAWMSFSPSGAPRVGPVALKTDKGEADKGGLADAKEKERPKADETPKPDAPTPKAVAEATPKPEAPKPEDKPTIPDATTTAPDLPPGVVGVAEKPSGVLLRFSRDRREWEQLTAETPLKDQDRLLSLSPFRATLTLGTAKVDLVGETEVWVLAPTPGHAARINLIQGRVVLHGDPAAAPFLVQFASHRVEITPPVGAVVGLERVNSREPGATVPAAPGLVVFATEGEVALAADDARETLAGPAGIVFDARGGWSGKNTRPAPSWVTERKPLPLDLQIGEHFVKYFRPDRPVIADLVEAMDDDQKDISRLALSALRALGDVSMVVPLLSSPENPLKRRSAIGVLRTYLAQSPEAHKDLDDQLLSTYGADLSTKIDKLLIGYTAKEARDDKTYEDLVKLLSSDDVGVRELALENLRTLTGRDELGYDPDQPTGKGLTAWKELQRTHELRAVATPKAEK